MNDDSKIPSTTAMLVSIKTPIRSRAQISISRNDDNLQLLSSVTPQNTHRPTDPRACHKKRQKERPKSGMTRKNLATT